ncbi:MAG TPA: hypothetical protein VFN97_17415 [Actinospica sp.]|nr:hypothetical protein [Actinospica sp.]
MVSFCALTTPTLDAARRPGISPWAVIPALYRPAASREPRPCSDDRTGVRGGRWGHDRGLRHHPVPDLLSRTDSLVVLIAYPAVFLALAAWRLGRSDA